MYDQIPAALDQAAKDSSVRVAVTRGTGDYYCSGTDLSNFLKAPPEAPEKLAEEGMSKLRWVGGWAPLVLKHFFLLCFFCLLGHETLQGKLLGMRDNECSVLQFQLNILS